MRSLLAAFRFLTRIPLPGPETRPEDIGRAVGWFPLVGGLVGLATAAAFVGAARLWPPLAAAVLAGAVHLTGALAARWLFFAEAEHVVGLYYGRRQASA